MALPSGRTSHWALLSECLRPSSSHWGLLASFAAHHQICRFIMVSIMVSSPLTSHEATRLVNAIVVATNAASFADDARLLQAAELPSQARDLDGDGKLDELVFQIDLAASQTRIVTIAYGDQAGPGRMPPGMGSAQRAPQPGRLRYGRADSHIGTGTAGSSAMTDTKKCLHPACHCLAAADSDYCSQYCKDAASKTEISCDCGQAGCALQVVAGPAPVEAA